MFAKSSIRWNEGLQKNDSLNLIWESFCRDLTDPNYIQNFRTVDLMGW